jgi:hypothetical protein
MRKQLMKPPSNITGIVPIEDMRGETDDETALLNSDSIRARNFILQQKWCFGIGKVYFGAGLGGVASIFLMEIVPLPTNVDRWVWVIVGDIPPAYLVTDGASNPINALEEYIELAREWVSLAYLSRASDEVIPVNRAPTPENAAILERRLNSLSKDILPWLAGGMNT